MHIITPGTDKPNSVGNEGSLQVAGAKVLHVRGEAAKTLEFQMIFAGSDYPSYKTAYFDEKAAQAVIANLSKLIKLEVR